MNIDILFKKEYNAIYKKIFTESENIMSWNLLKRERKMAKTITEKLAIYIADNHLSVTQVARDTAISEDKLQVGAKESLNATEFLELCSYLNVKPEELKKW